MNYIKNKQKDRPEFTFGNITVFVLEKPNVNLELVFDKLKKCLPKKLLKLIDTIYVGSFKELAAKKVNSVYMDGAIYIASACKSVDDAVDSVVHEFAHAFEDTYTNYLYDDQQIAEEFLSKRNRLKELLEDRGYDLSNYDFNDVDYNINLDDLLMNKLGYSLLLALTINLFINPYAITSLREYFGSAFEEYFTYKDRNRIQMLSPAVYDKLENIENEI